MTPVFCCGFECGVTGSVGQHWSTPANGSFSTSTVRSGARSMRVNPTASNGQIQLNNITLTTVNVIRFYLYFATLPTVDTPLLFLNASAGPGITFKQSNNSLYLGRFTGGVVSVASATGIPVATGQWYLIDYRINSTSNPWTEALSVNGVEVTFSHAVAGSTPTLLLLGSAFTPTTFDAFFDDFILSQTNGDYPIGPGHVHHFVPVSDDQGHNIAGTGDFQRTLTGVDILNATTTAFQLVDDVPLESGAGVDWINMVAPPNTGDYVSCRFGPAPGINSPDLPPRAVEVIAGIHQAATGTGNMEIRIRDAINSTTMYSATAVAGVTTIIYKRGHFASPPSGAAKWGLGTPGVFTNGNFNNIGFQFGSPSAVDANPDQYLDCIMIEAEFADFVSPKGKFIKQSINRSATY